ncbi:hypothetical protein F0P94_00045 [Adhaeribacter soli]|uniref:Lipoprotein n=2 Tax=Adhaeribacter soli TaxID=2607655 RepID=A0A5N1J476_9BACT|nr:hypothetical protein F0P94_00045 [Adhaeribacter soli]
MKKLITCFSILIFGTVSCNSAKKDILEVLQPTGNQNVVTSETYSDRSGFCSNSIFLNSDSTFSMEGGCEGRSYVAFGKWRRSRDSIEFKSLPKGSFNLVRKVEFGGRPSRGAVIFQINDKTGKPTQGFLIKPIKANEKHILTSNSSIIFNANGTKIEIYQTDVDGKAEVPIEDIDSLEFPQLQIFANRKLRFSTKGLTDSIKVLLNINSQTLAYPEISYHEKTGTFRCKIEKDKLRDGNWSLEKRNR